jgi:tRNA threonylcarbamoyladenosine biosynthesis protein TsaE
MAAADDVSEYTPPGGLTLHLPDEAATEALARTLAARLLPDAAQGARIYLRGELGAGKTAFARALLRACGVTGRIKSPSYALLESYNVSNLYFYHFDFYRFDDSREWLDAGFRDWLDADAVALIEWPERAGGLLPPPDLLIALSYAEPGRDARLTAHSARGLSWLNALVTPDSTHAPQAPPAGV